MSGQRVVVARPSTAQLRVLSWLASYPGLHIRQAVGGGVYWSAYWKSPEARRHMCETVAALGPEFTGIVPGTDRDPKHLTQPRWRDEGGTPRLVKQTFRALADRGWIERKWQEKRLDLGRVVGYRWVLSHEGRKVLFAHRHILASDGVEARALEASA